MNKKISILLMTLVLAANGLFAQEAIEISKEAGFLGLTPPTPIAIMGFSGEVDAVLKFDLTVMGFTNVPPEAAKYVLSGSNAGESVQGQLSLADTAKSHEGNSIRGARQVLFSKQYSGSSLRRQAHRLADDVVLKLTGINGIAETKIAFKVDNGRDERDLHRRF